MIPKKPHTSWLVWMFKVAFVTTGVSILSFGAAWGGSKLKLWSFFSKNTPPASSPKAPSTSETLDKKKKESASDEEKEAGSDEDSRSVVARSQTSNLLESTPNELQALTAAESYTESEIRKREDLIQDLNSLIHISTSKTAALETDWNSMRATGFSEEVLSANPIFAPFRIEEAIRNVHRTQIAVLENEINDYRTNPRHPSEEEKEKQKNEVLLQNEVLPQRISFAEGRIQELNFLINQSNSITEERKAEWESILTATAHRAKGLHKQLIMDDPAFKKLESDKAQVLADERAIRITYWTEVWVLRDQIKRDKNNIGEPSNLDKETTEKRKEPLPLDEEETSLTREEISLAIGPVTRSISTSCSSTRAILPITISKEKSPSPKEKSPNPSDSETPRIGWGKEKSPNPSDSETPRIG